MERKVFRIPEMKMDSDDGPGTFEGFGSTFGNVDEGGDVILKGAFADAIPDFLERGFVPVSHDWMGLPIATIAEAKETDDGLWFSAEFHSTSHAQEARTVMRERMERGKFVGLSIGYLPDYDDGVEYRDDGVRVLKKIKELVEISFVTVPMNRQAGITGVKSGQPLDTHFEKSVAGLGLASDFISRVNDLGSLRGKVAEGHMSKVEEVQELAEALVAACQSIPRPQEKTDTALALEAFRRRELLRDVDLLLVHEGA